MQTIWQNSSKRVMYKGLVAAVMVAQAEIAAAQAAELEVAPWARLQPYILFDMGLEIASFTFNVVFIKMRHFSDFETCSHILQVQFFPPKIQF
jgi:hypothetical protein